MCVPIIFGRLPSVLGSPVIVSGDLPIVLNCFFWQPSNWIVFSSIVSRFWPWASQVPFQHLYKSILGIDRMSPGLRLVRSIPWILFILILIQRRKNMATKTVSETTNTCPCLSWARTIWLWASERGVSLSTSVVTEQLGSSFAFMVAPKQKSWSSMH